MENVLIRAINLFAVYTMCKKKEVCLYGAITTTPANESVPVVRMFVV